MAPGKEAASRAAAADPASTSASATAAGCDDAAASATNLNDYVRQGGTERRWLLKQADKHLKKAHGRKLASALAPLTQDQEGKGREVDILVVGTGPAGLALAGELARCAGGRARVGLVGPDVPFVNTYGVWEDEFEELGLSHCLETVFGDAVCHFGEGAEGRVAVGRKYAKVDLGKLQGELLGRCERGGVLFEEGQVTAVDDTAPAPGNANSRPSGGGKAVTVSVGGKDTIACDVVVLASGSASSKFLTYEDEVPDPGAQTAYGFEVEIDAYPFGKDDMLFMDFRRHHSGVWPGKALHPGMARALTKESSWGTSEEVPSFLYAMPLGDNKAFFQETCLVSKDALPFEVLKRRLERRLEALNVKVAKVLDEEWSYIPVGGPLPRPDQKILAFGAAANLVHPASGYSVARSLKTAPDFASTLVDAYCREGEGEGTSKGWSEGASHQAWERLWSDELRKCHSFHVFGMELLALMDVKSINDFFIAFFSLPEQLWRGFLSSRLDSNQLLFFALYMFAVAPPQMKVRLVVHIFTPSGRYMLSEYKKALTSS